MFRTSVNGLCVVIRISNWIYPLPQIGHIVLLPISEPQEEHFIIQATFMNDYQKNLISRIFLDIYIISRIKVYVK